MNLPKLIAEARLLAETPCRWHPSDKRTPPMVLACNSCHADHHVNPDAEARHHWRALLAMRDFDIRAPRRYRNAICDHPDVTAWADAIANDKPDVESIILRGNVGVGKTWQAFGAIRRIIAARPETTWVAATFPDMVASLRPNGGQTIDHYLTADLLLLDDLGAEKPSEWVEEVTYRVVNARYEQEQPTIYATNCEKERLKATAGDRVLSRIAGSCEQIAIEGEDLRRAA